MFRSVKLGAGWRVSLESARVELRGEPGIAEAEPGGLHARGLGAAPSPLNGANGYPADGGQLCCARLNPALGPTTERAVGYSCGA